MKSKVKTYVFKCQELHFTKCNRILCHLYFLFCYTITQTYLFLGVEMKTSYLVLPYLTLLGAAAIMSGCFSSSPNMAESNIQIAQVCNTPQYDIILGKIESSKGNVLPTEEFKSILEKSLIDSGCFNIQSKSSDRTYRLDVKYNLGIQQTKEDTSIVSSKDNVTLKSDVQFNLYKKTNTIQQKATSTLKLSEKKYLGLGEDVQITQEQKENVLKRSFRTIFANLSNMPN